MVIDVWGPSACVRQDEKERAHRKYPADRTGADMKKRNVHTWMMIRAAAAISLCEQSGPRANMVPEPWGQVVDAHPVVRNVILREDLRSEEPEGRGSV